MISLLGEKFILSASLGQLKFQKFKLSFHFHVADLKSFQNNLDTFPVSMLEIRKDDIILKLILGNRLQHLRTE